MRGATREWEAMRGATRVWNAMARGNAGMERWLQLERLVHPCSSTGLWPPAADGGVNAPGRHSLRLAVHFTSRKRFLESRRAFVRHLRTVKKHGLEGRDLSQMIDARVGDGSLGQP